jgi:alkylhydroperoxidase family enzyme
MTNQYPSDILHLANAILTTPGDADSDLRYAVEARAAQLGGCPTTENIAEVPPELIRYIDKVALHAYKVTDADVEALRQAGYSEEAILEITLSAALGAGLSRLERGLAALKGRPLCD